MGNYRRWHIPWGAYFLTLATHERRRLFDLALARHLLGQAIRATLLDWPMTIHATVLLPDHLHLLCTLSEADQDYSLRIRLIKKRFTHAWLACGGSEGPTTPSRLQRGIRGVWEKRFYEHTIRNQREWRDHVDYIHMNPVKHGLAKSPVDWPWSSFHRFVREGQISPEWMGSTELHGAGECDCEIW